MTLGANYNYRSKATFYILSPRLPEEARNGLIQDGFGLLDARVTFDFASAPISVSVFGQNLADEEYIVSAQSFGAPISYVSAFSGIPRTCGVSLRYNY